MVNGMAGLRLWWVGGADTPTRWVASTTCAESWIAIGSQSQGGTLKQKG